MRCIRFVKTRNFHGMFIYYDMVRSVEVVSVGIVLFCDICDGCQLVIFGVFSCECFELMYQHV